MRKLKAFLLIVCVLFCGVTFAGCELSLSDIGSGKSAYEIAVDNGFVGTEVEWLESLKGQDGSAAEKGYSAYEIAVNNGFVGTEVEWLESLKGTNGKSAYEIAVDNGYVGSEVEWLAYIKGTNGTNGANGVDGQDLTAESLFELAVSFGMYENTSAGYEQFLSSYLSSNVNVENTVKNVANECLNKVVSIYCESDEGSLQSGAGVIYDIGENYCYIITNYHVVCCKKTISSSENNYQGSSTVYYEANTINMFLYGCESIYTDDDENVVYGSNAIKGECIAGSADYDLAVIKVVEDEFGSLSKIKNSSAKKIEFADTNNIQLGQTAIAIGNPMGAGTSVSSGIVSCNSEYISIDIAGKTRSLRCLRIDTSVNPGNSGGGLFNLLGELIGIVNAKSTEYDDVNYALSASSVKAQVENMIYFYEAVNHERVVGVFKYLIGMQIKTDNPRNVYDQINNTNTLFEDTVVDSVSGQQAITLGFVADDIIVQIKIENQNSEVRTIDISRRFILLDSMLTIRPGDKISFKIKRYDSQTSSYSEFWTEQITCNLNGYTEFLGSN